MASSNYTNYKLAAISGSIAPSTDTIKLALLKSTYTPDLDNHKFFSDVSAQESSGAGYTTGGIAATSKTLTQDSVNHRGVFDCDDAQWASSTIADARYLLVYKSTGTAGTSPLMALIDLGGTKSTSGDTFYVQFAATGVFYLG